jgi:DnaT-like ssDNA binding protein
MTTETVTIPESSGTVYDTYASVDQADLYLTANFAATAWFDLTEDQKAQLLVTSTRLLDRQCWLGDKTEDGQPLQWPRTDTGVEEVVDNGVPLGIVNGSIELAFAILDGSDVVNSNVPGAQKLRSIAAGSVNLSYFRGAEGDTARYGRFPLPVQELVSRYLCGGQQVAGLLVSGTGGISVTEDDLGYSEGV